MLRIVEYSPEYFDQLIDLNLSLVDIWYHFHGSSRGESDDWENLSAVERFHHGGPWNDPRTLAIHLRHYLPIGQIYVAVLDNTVVGEVEFHVVNKSVHIDWMMTHPGHRIKGIGRSLVQEIVKFANNNNLSSIWAEPEAGSESFYASVGFIPRQPNFIRYALRGGNMQIDESQQLNTLPRFSSYIYGETIHDPQYLMVLISSLLDYQPLFGFSNPIKIKEFTHQVQVIDRALPSIRNKRSVFISSSIPLSDEQVEQYLTNYVDSQSEDIEYYTTTLGNKIKYWQKYAEIDRLEKINHQPVV